MYSPPTSTLDASFVLVDQDEKTTGQNRSNSQQSSPSKSSTAGSMSLDGISADGSIDFSDASIPPQDTDTNNHININNSFPIYPAQQQKPINLPREHVSLKEGYVAGATTSYAHDWSHKSTGNDGIRIHGRHFVDSYGRVCNLRGVNLSGSCKIPVNHDDATFPAGHRGVTFVGRPFPLEEAHEHFSRLRRWGLTFVRVLVTWEAIEHAGPGIYDYKYLNYLRSLLSLLPNYGFTAFVSMHQDVWSRYSGGSGAPAWTLEAVGFDLNALEETGAAYLDGVKGGANASERGLWPTGYHKLAAATMATCFWAGEIFAPKLMVDDQEGNKIGIQQFLQGAFLNAFEALAKSVGDLDGVIGFEMINEPHPGFVNLDSLYSWNYNVDLHLGPIPSAFQAFQLGAGHPTTVQTWARSFPMPTRLNGSVTLNQQGVKVWRQDGPTKGECIWETHGVWGWDRNKNEGVVLRESYFKKHPMTGKAVDFYVDCYYPLLNTWAERIRTAASPGKIVFAEAIPNEFCPASWTAERRVPNMVYAPHWYDLNALFSKAFGDFTVDVQGLSRGMFLLRTLYWGQKGARDNYSLQIRNIVERAYKVLGENPVIIGETGIPMDLNNGEAFGKDDYTWQARMMDAILVALERSLVGFTLWNYNPLNDDQVGDSWNGENFSWFSRKRALPPSLLDYDQQAVTLDNGGRILTSIVRPYPAKTAGVPVRFEYEQTTGVVEFEWVVPDPSVHEEGEKNRPGRVSDPPIGSHPRLLSRETEIFIPAALAQNRRIVVTGLDLPISVLDHDEKNPTEKQKHSQSNKKDYTPLDPQYDSYYYNLATQTLYILQSYPSLSPLGKTKKKKRYSIRIEITGPGVRPAFVVNDFWVDFEGPVMSILVCVVALVVWMGTQWWAGRSAVLAGGHAG